MSNVTRRALDWNPQGKRKEHLTKECRCGGQSRRNDMDGTKEDIPEPCALEECCCGPVFHEKSRGISQVSQSDLGHWPLTFDLLTWISIGVIYSSRTIYLPSLKLLGQSILELSVALIEVDWHDLWPWPLTWVSIGVIYSSRTIYLPSLKLLGQCVLELSVAQGEVDWHDLWPWPLTYWSEYQ